MGGELRMSIMKDPTFWEDEDHLIEYLAYQLNAGRLALFLGAGVSRDFGLPDWYELMARISQRVGAAPFTKEDNAPRRAQAIKEANFKNDPERFLDLVQSSLYEGVSIDLEVLTRHRLLAAIGSLVMSSRRGSASKVVTLNFDDILETFLEYYGFVVASVITERHWAPNSDVVVYHPHGFLPQSNERRRSSEIVLASSDFFRAISHSPTNAWRLLLVTLLRTHTVLHVGMSGDDMNVESLMNDVKALHAASPDAGKHSSEAAFNAVRFAERKVDGVSSDDQSISFRQYGVYTHNLASWNDLPSFMFRICQKARSFRVTLEADR